MTLGEFLKEQVGSTEPWNCSTMPADWCMELGYLDFAFEWRGVTGPGACEDAHLEPGELLSLWQSGIGTALPVVEDEYDAGDIAVLESPVWVIGTDGKPKLERLESGAIFTGGKWVLRGQRRLHFLSPGQVRVIQAWRP